MGEGLVPAQTVDVIFRVRVLVIWETNSVVGESGKDHPIRSTVQAQLTVVIGYEVEATVRVLVVVNFLVIVLVTVMRWDTSMTSLHWLTAISPDLPSLRFCPASSPTKCWKPQDPARPELPSLETKQLRLVAH